MLEQIFIAGHAGKAERLTPLLNDKSMVLDAIIITTVGESVKDWIKDNVQHLLHLEFDDVSNPDSCYTTPKKEHIKQAVDFAKDKKSLVIACHAGISRSSATAFVIASHFWGIDRAIALLDMDIHYPNKLIIKLGDEIFPDLRIQEEFFKWNDLQAIQEEENWT